MGRARLINCPIDTECPITGKGCGTALRSLKCKCETCLRYKRWYQKHLRLRKPEIYKQYQKNRSYESCKNNQLKQKFGITYDKYMQMVYLQQGVCAICNKVCPSGRKLAVDHCHKTNKIRGLLCTKCNQGIGQFDENPTLFLQAIKYLKQSFFR